MSNERKRAQPECVKFFHSLPMSWVKKNIDGTQCPHCHKAVLPTTDTGASDYTGVINRYGIAIEVKAGSERIAFNAMTESQYTWLDDWQQKTGCMAWVWLLLGTATRINDKSAIYPLETYLIPFDVWREVRRQLETAGVQNLPMNAEAAKTRLVTRNGNLYAERILSDYRCAWRDGLWVPQPIHLFWRYYDLNPNL